MIGKFIDFCGKLVRGVFSLFGIVLAAALGVAVIAILFADRLPLGTPSAALTAKPKAPYLDMHTHVAGIGAGDSGCFVSNELLESYKFGFYLRGFGVTRKQVELSGDGLIVKKLSKLVKESKYVSHAVVLALDGIIKEDGTLDRERTQVYVPNDYLASETAKYKNLFWGASINPYRPDALERLDKAKAEGAVLIKWIPSIMYIDPADERIIPFYKRMNQLGLPLLTHAGQERSFAHARDELADPVRLTLPLSYDVTVIGAHIASTGSIEGVEYYRRILPMFERFTNLYTDISSLTQVNKLGYLGDAVEKNQVVQRMLYGSDWPLQFFPLVSPWYHLGSITAADAQFISKQENVFDRDVLLKKAYGVPEPVFYRAAGMLPLLRQNSAAEPSTEPGDSNGSD